MASGRRWIVVVGLAVLAGVSACGSNPPTAPSALTISEQPQSQAISSGANATLSVGGKGAGSLSYQWYVGASGTMATPIGGATSSIYTTPALTTTTSYWARVTDANATADSATATVTVSAPGAVPPPPPTTPVATAPSITTQPESQTVASGQTATLSVGANGTAPLSYQWYAGQSGTTSAAVSGAMSATFTTPALTTTTSYWARVTNGAGTADTATATLTVSPAPAPPAIAVRIARQPESRTIAPGQTATLTVETSGTVPIGHQWHVGSSGTTSTPVAGATSTTFTTPALTTTTSYWVRVSNAGGTEDSSTATITVSVPPPTGIAPTITAHPQSQTVTSGQTATLSVAVSGTAPLGYQWYVALSSTTPAPVAGATSAGFTTSALTATTSVWVRVSNAFGASDSIAATITVTPDASGAGLEDQVLTLVNQRRAAGATCGGTPYPPVGPLTMNASLRTAARGHSQDMAAQNYFSHTSLDGRTFDQRFRNAGYSGAFPWGENIAGGQSTPQSAVDGWMASPGHCTNIMNGSFRATGVGYAFRAGSTYSHYWTQTFGGS